MWYWKAIYKDGSFQHEVGYRYDNQSGAGHPVIYKAHELPNQEDIVRVEIRKVDELRFTLIVSPGTVFRKYIQVTHCVDSGAQRKQQVFALESGNDKSYLIIDDLDQVTFSRTLDF